MKFDDAINYIAEHTLDLEMAKPKNREIEKLVAQGIPYYKARKIFNAKKLGGTTTPAAAPAAEPAGVKYKELPDTLRTKEAVAGMLQADPNLTPQEIMARLAADNSEETPYNLDPTVVKAAVADASMGGDTELEPQIDPAELKKAAGADAIRARMAARGIKLGDPSKIAKLQGAVKKLQSRGRKSSGEELAGFKEPEPEEIIGGTGSQNPHDYEGQED